jgi:O-antigen ligase
MLASPPLSGPVVLGRSEEPEPAEDESGTTLLERQPAVLWLLGGYIWLFLHRPFEVWESLGALHVERLYMAVILLACAVYGGRGWVRNRLTLAFGVFIMALIVCWILSPYEGLGQPVVEDYLKCAVVFVLVLLLVGDERQLRFIVKCFLIAMFLYMAHSFKEFRNGRHEFRMGIVRMIGVDQTFNNPNSFAATLLFALPMTFPFWDEARRWRDRLPLLAYTGLTVVCILLTGSRGNLVGLLCLSALKLLTSKRRVRVLILVAIALPVGWVLLTPSLQNRFLTLVDSKRGPENAKESADFRSHALVDGARLWEQSPATGFGPGSFGKAAGHGWQAHNLYAQTIGEMGTLGAVTFLGVLAAFALNAWEMRVVCGGDPRLSESFDCRVSRAVSLAIILLLILGFGGHNLYRYNWMWFGAFQAVALKSVKDRAELLAEYDEIHGVGDNSD